MNYTNLYHHLLNTYANRYQRDYHYGNALYDS